MTRNLSNTDRAVRAGLGVVLTAAALWAGISSLAGVVLLVLALVMFATAAVAFCPLYVALGLSTCPSPHRTRRAPAGAAQRS